MTTALLPCDIPFQAPQQALCHTGSANALNHNSLHIRYSQLRAPHAIERNGRWKDTISQRPKKEFTFAQRAFITDSLPFSHFNQLRLSEREKYTRLNSMYGLVVRARVLVYLMASIVEHQLCILVEAVVDAERIGADVAAADTA